MMVTTESAIGGSQWKKCTVTKTFGRFGSPRRLLTESKNRAKMAWKLQAVWRKDNGCFCLDRELGLYSEL